LFLAKVKLPLMKPNSMSQNKKVVINQIKFFSFLILFFASCPSFAQIKNYKRGLNSFQNGYYDIAIQEFLKVKELDTPQLVDLNLKIADAYRLTNRWIETIPYYEKAFTLGSTDADAIFNYAYALKANEEYTKAKAKFEEYIALKPDNKVYLERALRETNTLQMIEDIKSKKTDLEFKNLTSLNSEGIEFSGIVQGGYLVYSASKKDKIYANGLPYLGIYKSKVDPNLETFGPAEPFSKNIMDPERNEGTPTFTPDGKTMVFARGNSGKRKDISPDVDLYISRLVPNEGWTEPKLVSASDSLAWDGSPAFSRDGKTLYFSSNRSDGIGGLDIYRVNMDASGRFGNPVNMGKAINTAGDEMFPFVTSDGKLYFASDGHPGLGKLDLFVAERKAGKISVDNMGLPFNSSMDDFGLSIDEVGNIFFTSNRTGGKGNDDIYYYQAPKAPKDETSEAEPSNPLASINDNPQSGDLKVVNYYLEGEVAALIKDKKQLLDSARVRIFKFEGGIEELVAQFETQNGKFGPQKLEEDTDYIVLVDKAKYLTKRENFSMYGRNIPQALLKKPITDTTYYTNINLEQVFIGKTFRLENIYYDLDKFDIRDDAAKELDKLVQILRDNPSIKIELGSHTDSRGTDIYNIRLSQKRAESVINYLSIKGISKERLSAKGYGETELIVQNAKTEEEHQVNRRTEFKVLEIDQTSEM
jgi:peptidoglycan-associated lipoprotein